MENHTKNVKTPILWSQKWRYCIALHKWGINNQLRKKEIVALDCVTFSVKVKVIKFKCILHSSGQTKGEGEKWISLFLQWKRFLACP